MIYTVSPKNWTRKLDDNTVNRFASLGLSSFIFVSIFSQGTAATYIHM